MPPTDLREALARVAEHSDFYRDLWSGVDLSTCALSDLPIVGHDAFWNAMTVDGAAAVIGDPLSNGLVLGTGGTSGAPKVSYWELDEWRSMTDSFAQACRWTGRFEPGTKVANLFKAGGLYGSMFLMHDALRSAVGLNCVEFPVGADGTLDETVQLLASLDVDVLAGAPTVVMSILSRARSLGLDLNFSTALVGGESTWPGQRRFLEEVCGATVIFPFYASTDAATLGFADASAKIDHYRTFDGEVILEIVDDAGHVIDVPGKVGTLLATSLCKFKMPVVRYPVGDLAEWVDGPGIPHREFRLAGRSFSRTGGAAESFDINSVRRIIYGIRDTNVVTGMQVILTDDGPRIRIATEVSSDPERERIAEDVLQILASPAFGLGKGAPSLEFVKTYEITANARSLKSLGVIDERGGRA